MLMIWICYFINHHFELLDHKGSSAGKKKSLWQESRWDTRKDCECVCVCVFGCAHTSLSMYVWMRAHVLITASGNNYCRDRRQSIRFCCIPESTRKGGGDILCLFSSSVMFSMFFFFFFSKRHFMFRYKLWLHNSFVEDFPPRFSRSPLAVFFGRQQVGAEFRSTYVLWFLI